MQIGSSSPLAYPARHAAITTTTKLSEDEQKQLRELKQRDTEVRAHEAAHKAVAGQYATGAASFSYQRGPDGSLYAIGGEVGIDTRPIADNPEASLQKAIQIRAAALAPAQPSGQDMAVASAAALMAAAARSEIMSKQKEALQVGADSEKQPGIKRESEPKSPAQQYQIIANTTANTAAPLVDLSA